MSELNWVVGARGLLGSAVVRGLRAGGDGRVMTSAIPWGDEPAAIAAFGAAADRFTELAAGGAWNIIWCAGAGVPATPADVLEGERRVLQAWLDSVAPHLGGGLSEAGAVFLASSAGAVYGGCPNPPYDEHTEPAPLSHYGVAKLAQEDTVRAFTERTGVASLIGRISNLYGPGQNLHKPQGIISKLCAAHLTGQPTSIYVSMDTIRDYIYVDDCAAKIIDGLRLLRTGHYPDRTVVKVLAAQQGVTLGAVLGECRRVFKRPPRVILGSSALSSVQSRDLRLASVVAPAIDSRPMTTMGAGISATTSDLARAFQRGDFARELLAR